MSPPAGDVMLAEDLQIQEDAFQEAANSKFCYLDPPRRHAFGRLLSGLYEGDGLFLLTGRAGIGKTVLLHHLSEQLKALDGVLPLYPMQVFACRSGTTLADVFGACESRLGLGESATAPLKATKKLQQLVESDRSPVLLLDDADLLGDEVLDALVTLTGLQAADRHLLSLVLAGQPDVAARVAAITGDGEGSAADRAVELQPMAEPDVARLIRHRLRAAGRAEETFDADAMARIIRHGAGVPLTIVLTCRRALQIAESRSRKTVTVEIVAEAIGEEGASGQRQSARSIAAAVASPALQHGSSEFSPPRPSPASAESKVAFSASVEPRSASPSPAESRPTAVAPARRLPEPSLRREQHASIPEVTLGHHGRSAPRAGGSDSPPAASREAAWWSSNTVHSAPPELTTVDRPMERRRRGGKRATFAIAGGVLFLVLSAAALAVFMGGPTDFGGRSGTSSATGAGSAPGTPPAYDARSELGGLVAPRHAVRLRHAPSGGRQGCGQARGRRAETVARAVFTRPRAARQSSRLAFGEKRGRQRAPARRRCSAAAAGFAPGAYHPGPHVARRGRAAGLTAAPTGGTTARATGGTGERRVAVGAAGVAREGRSATEAADTNHKAGGVDGQADQAGGGGVESSGAA